MIFEQEMKASREDSLGRIWQCLSELDEFGKDNREKADYVWKLSHAFFWLGRVSGLDEGYKLKKSDELEQLVNEMINVYDAKARSIEELEEEEEINPISEKAKSLAMRIARYDEQLKQMKRKRKAIKREMKRGL